jgi:tetratricopeptide (TPR) repeat protein
MLALTFLWALTNPLFAQAPKVEFPAASPTCTIKQHFGLTDVEIVYSRPGMKGRTIFGSLVPYDKVWRTGANNATKITFSTAVKLNGAEIPAGTYALFTIPGENEWTIIISKNVTQSALQYDEKADVVRVKATPVKLAETIETFTIEFNNITGESAVLNLVWEKTVVPIKLEVELAGKLMPQIEAVMASDEKNKPYYQAAMFYYDHGQDLQKARKWVDAAIAAREAHYIVHLKAKILAKLGDKEGAIAAAKRSIELAIKANDTGYVKMNEDLISSLK